MSRVGSQDARVRVPFDLISCTVCPFTSSGGLVAEGCISGIAVLKLAVQTGSGVLKIWYLRH